MKDGPEDPFALLARASAQLEQLTGDEFDAAAEVVQSWWATHCIRAGRGGAALPELLLWRQGPWMLVGWRGDAEPFALANTRFVAQPGVHQVPAARVASVLLDLCEAVQERLNSQGVGAQDDHEVAEFQSRFAALRSERYRFLFAVAESGLPTWLFELATDLPPGTIELVERGEAPNPRWWDHLRDHLDLKRRSGTLSLEEVVAGSAPLALFRSAAPTLDEHDVRELVGIIQSARRDGYISKTRIGIARSELSENAELNQLADGRAYQIGQRRARAFREYLGLSARDRFDVEAWLSDAINRPVVACRLSDASIDGVSLWSDTLGPVVAINQNGRFAATQWGRRMALAHELSHLLFDTLFGRPIGIASGEWAPLLLERTANAFAAELLLPRSALQAIEENLEEDAAFMWLMEHYGVGALVAAHQLRNHGFVSSARFYHLLSMTRSGPGATRQTEGE